MELKKRAQVTIFIVVAIIIVVAVAILFVFIRNQVKEPAVLTGTGDVNNLMQDCLVSTAEDALELVGRQGGYYELGGVDYLDYIGLDQQGGSYETYLGRIKIPYYFKDEINSMPSREFVQDQISSYIQDKIPECVGNFQDYKDKGFSVEEGIISVDTIIQEDRVLFNLKYPVTFSKGDSIQSFESFSTDLPIRLGKVYNLTKDFIDNQTACGSCLLGWEEGDEFCNCLDPYHDNLFYVTMGNYLEDNYIFVVSDSQRKLKGEYYDFIFVNKY